MKRWLVISNNKNNPSYGDDDWKDSFVNREDAVAFAENIKKTDHLAFVSIIDLWPWIDVQDENNKSHRNKSKSRRIELYKKSS